MNIFSFKLGPKSTIEYLAVKIPLDTDDLDATSIDGKEFYMITWEINGKQYQDEVLTTDVTRYLDNRSWIKINKEVVQ